MTPKNLLLLVLQWHARRARRDPVAFAELAFSDESGRPLKLARIHRELQQFLGDSARALVELPRDHGKTVQVLIRILWELGHNPNLRVLLASGSSGLAVQRGRFLRDAIAENPGVRMVFPNLVPARPWRVTAFSVRRSGKTVSPTVAVVGVGACSTGARADILVCDDVVDVRALRSERMRDKVKVIYRENLINLLEPGGRAWLLFTPWHAADLNAELKANPGYRHFRRAVGDDLEPIWPEKWPRERLLERRAEIGESSFARAFRLKTIAAEDCVIRPQWVRYWEEEPLPLPSPKRGGAITNGNGPAAGDFALPETSRNAPIDRPSPLRGGEGERFFDSIILAVDPAVSQKQSADASALVTLGRTADGRVFCLEAIARRFAAPELVQFIDDADRRWRPDVILFESNSAFKGIKDLLARHARFGSKVQEVAHSRDKFARINAFSVRVQNAAFLLHGEAGRVDPAQQELLDEMLAFPVGSHDDLLDAAAFGTAHLLDTPEPRVWCM
jgi:predicted phage terminase large subunit-like protein